MHLEFQAIHGTNRVKASIIRYDRKWAIIDGVNIPTSGKKVVVATKNFHRTGKYNGAVDPVIRKWSQPIMALHRLLQPEVG